jgi:hypothetical protein
LLVASITPLLIFAIAVAGFWEVIKQTYPEYALKKVVDSIKENILTRNLSLEEFRKEIAILFFRMFPENYDKRARNLITRLTFKSGETPGNFLARVKECIASELFPTTVMGRLLVVRRRDVVMATLLFGLAVASALLTSGAWYRFLTNT